jgi:ubiquinol-cytochrome c reductase iron-sulfur subunit
MALAQAGNPGRGRHLYPPGLLAFLEIHPGPQPSLPDDWEGGFLCPCHGSTFDMAGRVFKNKPAPDNLQVPRHMYLSDTKLVIGKDEKGEA